MNLYSQVKNNIFEKILDGTFKLGEQIPTEMELTAELGVSRPTVRQALNQLVNDGYLIRIKGRGSFVTQPKIIHKSTSIISSYKKEMESNNTPVITEVLKLETVTADEFVTSKLNLTNNKKVIVLTRLRTIAGENCDKPVVLTTVYVPYHKFPQMTKIDFTTTSFYDAMKEKGLFVQHASRELEVIMPDKQDAKLLQIGSFDPVIFISSVGTLADSTIIEYSESIYPANNSKFLIDIYR